MDSGLWVQRLVNSYLLESLETLIVFFFNLGRKENKIIGAGHGAYIFWLVRFTLKCFLIKIDFFFLSKSLTLIKLN